MRNLARLVEAGLPAPPPVVLRNHVLVMQFIGTAGVPAPRLKARLHYCFTCAALLLLHRERCSCAVCAAATLHCCAHGCSLACSTCSKPVLFFPTADAVGSWGKLCGTWGLRSVAACCGDVCNGGRGGLGRGLGRTGTRTAIGSAA